MKEICMMTEAKYEKAASILKQSRSTLLFTGAGISVESGIPPFRGAGGLWNVHDPSFIEIDHFLECPEECWKKIREIFYDHWGKAEPNAAHKALAELQSMGLAGMLVTQNIDCLHQRAGSTDVVEFHGTLERLVCMRCSRRFPAEKKYTDQNLPTCPECGGLLKPDIVFFGEGIPEDASDRSFDAAEKAEAVIVVGTSGGVMPACMIPHEAHRAGAKIIEVNPDPSAFMEKGITDIFLQGPAGTVLPELLRCVRGK